MGSQPLLSSHACPVTYYLCTQHNVSIGCYGCVDWENENSSLCVKTRCGNGLGRACRGKVRTMHPLPLVPSTSGSLSLRSYWMNSATSRHPLLSSRSTSRCRLLTHQPAPGCTPGCGSFGVGVVSPSMMPSSSLSVGGGLRLHVYGGRGLPSGICGMYGGDTESGHMGGRFSLGGGIGIGMGLDSVARI